MKLKINEMNEKEEFVLQWLNTEDVYEALNPNFIEEFRMLKMSSKDKGKVVLIENEEEEVCVNEERFQRDLIAAKMMSTLETRLPEGEPSTRREEGMDAEDRLYEEELVDYGSTHLTPRLYLH